MKKSVLIVFIASLLVACHSDINLKDIDTTSELEMGLALPVGSVRAKLGDFVNQVRGLYIDSANGGVITWRDTFPDQREYHKFDMKDHISEKDLELKVYENAKAAQLIGDNGKVNPYAYDHQVTLTFELPLRLKDINKELGKERLDSALIEEARFSSIIDTTHLPLKWEWIDEVELVLGEQVYRQKGNVMTVYSKAKGDTGGYGQKFNTTVDDFSISLMKNKNLSIEHNTYFEYEQNVIDSCVFAVNFKFTIPSGSGDIYIKEDAKINYHLEVEFIDYLAIWGFFNPSKDMISKNVEIDMSESWGDISFLERASVPFTDPSVDVQVTTKIAGAMMMKGNHLYVINKNNDTTYATFNGQRSRPAVPMMPYMHPDPRKPGSAINDSVTTSVIFNKDADKGCIDKLFVNMPQKMGYDFEVYFNDKETPQIRITPDTKVSINAVCKLPLKFRDGLFVDYADTIKDVDLSSVDIDSLLREVDYVDTLKASDINLYVTALSEIPITVKGVFKFLDAAGQPLKDPKDPTKDFNPFLEDTIRIVPPRYERSSMGTWAPTDGGKGKSILTASMTKEKLDMLPKVKKIAYKVIIDNEALTEAFKKGLNEVALTEQQRLELNIGLTAHLDAIMNFNKDKK